MTTNTPAPRAASPGFILAVRMNTDAGMGAAAHDVARLLDHIAALEALLRDALEFADEGWGYADKYYCDKWDYAGQRAAIAGVLSDPPPPPATEASA